MARGCHESPAFAVRNDVVVIDPGPSEALDLGSLHRIREAFSTVAGRARVGIDVSRVDHLPPGFFGMLADWADAGAEVFLFGPPPRVREMIWFRMFASPAGDGAWRIGASPLSDLPQDVDETEADQPVRTFAAAMSEPCPRTDRRIASVGR